MAEKKVKLTDKQQAFINAYLICWNAAKAARIAGYSEKTAAQSGVENLSKPYLRKIIDTRIEEMAMTANEALMRLSEMARADVGDFVGMSADEIKEHPKSFLLKKVKRTVRYDKLSRPIETVELELHDSQSALVNVLKELHLNAGEPTDRTDLRITDARERLASLLTPRSASDGTNRDTEYTQ